MLSVVNQAKLRWLEAYPPYLLGKITESHRKLLDAKSLIDSIQLEELDTEAELLKAGIYNDLAATSFGSDGSKQQYLSLAREIRTRRLGEIHPDTAMTIGNIAQNCGDRKEREALHKHALQIRLSTLGPVHTWTSWSYVALSELYLREHESALALHHAHLAISAAEGVRGPAFGTALSQLALCHSEVGNHAAAVAAAEAAVVSFKENLGEHHESTLDSIRKLSKCFFAANRFDECFELTNETAMATQRWLGPNHRHRVADEQNLAMCLRQFGRTKEALVHAENAYAIAIRLFGADAAQVIEPAYLLSDIYETQRRPDKALQYANIAHKLAISHPTISVHKLVNAILTKSKALAQKGLFSEAIKLLLNSRKKAQRLESQVRRIHELERSLCAASPEARKAMEQWHVKNASRRHKK